MRLLALSLENYRNIASALLVPGPELTVICGNNGQGKTNLLEAVWLLTGGKSFRGGKDAELVRRGAPYAALEARTRTGSGKENEVRLTVGAAGEARTGRYAVWNGTPPKRASSLAGSFPAVVFDPGHLSLVKGPPDGRRRFLDAALCQLYPGYLAIYRRYVRILQQKNSLLRRSPARPERPLREKLDLLEVLNEELVPCGEEIQARRREYLGLLAPMAAENYRALSRGAEQLGIGYEAQFEPGGLAGLLAAGWRSSVRRGWLPRYLDYPRICLTVPSIVIMVPGMYLYRAMFHLGQFDTQLALDWAFRAFMVIVCLPIGLAMARVITDKSWRYDV